jgi:hypothetical protein
MTRAQLPKYAIRAMVDVNMNPTPMKVIRNEAYLQIKGPFGLSKDPKPEKRFKHLKEGRIKGSKKLHENGRWRCGL